MPMRAPRHGVARLVPMVAAALFAVAACAGPLAPPTPVPAATDTTTDTRQLDEFTSVSVDGPLNVVFATSASANVDVEAASNVTPLVSTTVSGSELVVGVTPPGFASAKPVTVRITAPHVTSLSLTGGAQGTMEVMAKAMAVSVSGGATLRGIGSVEQLTVTTLGNSDAQLGDLAADSASIAAAGGAKATLKVSKQLTGTADGGAVITLTATPVAQSVTLTGGAKLVGP